MDYNVDNIESKSEIKPTMDTDVVLHKDGKFQRAKIFGFDGKIKKAFVEAVVNETTINNTYELDPEQIVPSEALYNDSTETLAVDVSKRVDKITGLDVNYREVTAWYDGSPMTEAKADGVIYRKTGSKYHVLVDYLTGIPINVKFFGVIGDGITDDTKKNQKAIDLHIKLGFTLYYPKGIYLLSYTQKESNYRSPFDISSSDESGKSIKIIGEGSKKTIFKLADGEVDIKGRYTEFIRYYANKQGKTTSKVELRGFAIDMNARSNTFPLVATTGELYSYEKSHAIAFNAGDTSSERMGIVDINDVEILDKVGGGIVFGTTIDFQIQRLNLNNILSTTHSLFPNSIYTTPLIIGMRGCIELGGNVGSIFITDSNLQYSQIEPVIPSSATKKRNTNVLNSVIDKFEFTDSGGYSFVSGTNLTSKSFLIRGINGNFSNCTLIFGGICNGILKFSKCTFLIPYKSETNTIEPVTFGSVAGSNEKYTCELNNVSFLIDNSDSTITPIGFLLKGNGSIDITQAERYKYYLTNCIFDLRAEYDIDAYANGVWKINNCDFGARKSAIKAGGYSTYYSSVEIYNCFFNRVTEQPIELAASTLNWYLKIVGVYPLNGKPFIKRVGGTAFIPNTSLPNSATFVSDVPVTSMVMPYNQLIIKPDASGGQIGWRQVSLTTTQTWKEIYDFSKAASDPNSTATDVAGLVTDFNDLLAKLRTAGIIAT